MSHPDDLIAVLDANVLYPQWLRDVMLTLAAMGYYEPRWSSHIIDEMRRNVLADHADIDPRRFDDTTIAALHAAFPHAWVEPPGELIATMDNDPGDRHVLATAVAAEAHLVVTANVTDFESPRYVTPGRVKIETPNDFLISVLDGHPDLVATVLLHLATRRRGVDTIADVLDQLARNHALSTFVGRARPAAVATMNRQSTGSVRVAIPGVLRRFRHRRERWLHDGLGASAFASIRSARRDSTRPSSCFSRRAGYRTPNGKLAWCDNPSTTRAERSLPRRVRRHERGPGTDRCDHRALGLHAR